MILSYRRGNLEGLLEIVVLACEIRSYFKNEPYELAVQMHWHPFTLFSLINVFLKMKAKRRMEMAKTQKNEGFLARLVKITNTFVQKPLIFAHDFNDVDFNKWKTRFAFSKTRQQTLRVRM